MSGSQDEIPPPPPPPPSSSQTPTQQTPHTVSTIKLPILKKGEYDIWAMKMEHYLAHTDYPIWEVIQNGNGPVSITTDTQGQIKVLPPRTAEEIVARERERKARTTLLMALPEDHLAKFHKMTDAKEMWDAIKSRFGGNDESKKMQKFQSLLSQLEIHGAGVSTEDANKKFLRSLLSSWSQVSLIMRTKLGVDSLIFDDLYNNLRVFENDVKGSTASSSSSQNVAFVSENTNSTNDVSIAYSVSNTSSQNPQYEQTSSYSLLANQSSCPQLDHEDLEQLDEYDLEEMDLKWQVAMLSMRMKKFYKKTGHFARECRIKGNQDNRKRDAWNSGNKDGNRTRKKEDSKALVTIDGEGVDWTSHSEEDEDYALMACNSSKSDTEAYSQGLKKVEAQLVAHQQGQQWYEQKIKCMKIDLDDKTDVLTYHKKLLAEAQKEKEDLKAKVEKWHNSSKNLSKLLNTQMSANDKFGLGYGDHRYDGNYMPSGPGREVDDSMFTYGPKKSKTSESDTQTSNFDSCESNSSVETLESVPEPIVVEPKVVSQPKIWSDAPIIEEYKETVKEQNTYSPSPKADKRDWNGLMSKRLGLGYGFTKKACFVCGSFSHLIRDCDFHEKRMAKQVELNKRKVNTARQNLSSQAAITSTARKVNIVRPIVNEIKSRNIFYKSHSPIRRPFNRTTTSKAKFSNQKVNTAEVKAVSAVGGKRETAVKPSTALKNKGIVDSGCSRDMTDNKAYLIEYQDYNRGPFAFGGSKGYITGKGKIKTGKLDFEDVCFVKELHHFNLFSVSQMCDKKNKVLFIDTKCLVLSSDFKLPDEK
ncbi:hypothetical protein Tco_1086827 [Tanacetum coccineum]